MAAAEAHRADHPRLRAARGLHHPVGVQPRRRPRGRGGGRRAREGRGLRAGRGQHDRLRRHRRGAHARGLSRGRFFFASPEELRSWLAEHHERERELLVGLYRKGAGEPTITWPQLVDELLCVGWIDGVRRGIDERAYSIRITPRKARSNWSAVNVRRYGELEAEGRVLPAGRAAWERREDARTAIYSYEREHAAFDADQETRFRAEPAAWAFFTDGGAVLPARRHALGHQRQAARDARAPARAAHRRFRGRPAVEAPDPAGWVSRIPTMKITVTGATGLIGRASSAPCRHAATRSPCSPATRQGRPNWASTRRWDPMAGPAPAAALKGRDAVVHLAGENVAQRWSDDAKRAIRESREVGTRNLVAGSARRRAAPRGARRLQRRGYYGSTATSAWRGDARRRRLPGRGLRPWEREAAAARPSSALRVVHVRTGIVLDRGRRAGEDAAAVQARRRRPGRRRRPVPAVDPPRRPRRDLPRGARRQRLDGPGQRRRRPRRSRTRSSPRRWAARCTAPRFAPVPGLRRQALYGEMAEIVTEGQRVVPARAKALGYSFAHPELDEALRDALR